MELLQLLASDNFITVNKNLIKAIGLEEAVLIGELASEYQYWSQRGELRDGYFYSTIENIEEKTTLSAHKQRQILNKLKKLGIVDIKIMGMPCKRFIKINEKSVVKNFNNKMLKNLTTSCENFKQQDVKNFNINNNIYNNNINNKYKNSKSKILGNKYVNEMQEEYNDLEQFYSN